MNIQELIPAFEQFQTFADPLLHIQDEESYEQAREAIEAVFELAGDHPEDKYGALIDLLGKAINDYEELHDEGMSEFLSESRKLPADVSLLGVLIEQHSLTYSDLPEIGGKSMVSQVMSGKKTLSRAAIDALAKRFGISAKLFFD